MLNLLILACFALGTAIEIKTPKYYFAVTENTTLDCSSLGTAKFYHENKLITSETFSNARIIDDNKLQFSKLTLEQIKSNYTCFNKESKKSISFDKHPIVSRLTEGFMRKLVDGTFEIKVNIENMQKNCTWIEYVDNNIVYLNSTDDIKLENASMTLKNLKEHDAGKYGCLVANSFGFIVVYSVVEVKPMTYALWPFLAICIQCLLCCIGIFAYEKLALKKKDDNHYELSQQHILTGRMASA
ncbi:neuroplastin [Brachionus plicatilis]|uniref:Neuroplastin n=1 Tax=Brachionus plicatilis TaxID=10195 RepID=A0A3M7S9C4_BRAPC|nr:neuroplastin [Brachionus plicatilis]